MKIYVAYRTGYESNLRKVSEFKADSILDWFQENWAVLCSDDYDKLIGFDIYGLPLSDYQNDEKPIPVPQTIEQLADSIRKFTYINEIYSSEQCIEVLTDDDEIELAWYVFDDNYKQNNMNKLSLWFLPKLPTRFLETIKNEFLQHNTLPIFNVTENKHKVTYLMTSAIYDGANIEDTSFIALKGVRITDFIERIRHWQDFKMLEQDGYRKEYGAIDTLIYLNKIANELDSNDWCKVIDIFNKYPATEVKTDTDKVDLAQLAKDDYRNDPEKSLININEHIIELGINSIGEYYNYYVMFDDLWVAENEKLALSFMHFGKTWRI